LEERSRKRFSEHAAANVRTIRTERELSQADVARRMVALGHEKWARGTVSDFESGKRGLSIDEFFSLCLVLTATPVDLLDPGDGSVIAGGPVPALPAEQARHWAESRIRLGFTPPNAWSIAPRGPDMEAALRAFEALGVLGVMKRKES
jgi:transcriptional regulator with XRE-family HTH domain